MKIFFIIVISAAAVFLLLLNDQWFFDEGFHYYQIGKFIEGRYELSERVPMLPGYHLIVSLIARSAGVKSFTSVRLISTMFSFLLLGLFFLFAKDLHRGSRDIMTLQYYFFPTIFPYFSLLFTDILSAFMVLLSIYLITKKMNKLAWLSAACGFLVRQNNIVWIAFLAIYGYLTEFGWRLDAGRAKEYLKKNWAMLPAALLFVIFIVLNKGMAIGDKCMHPSLKIYMGNIHFILFLYFFLFLPTNLYRFKDALGFAKKHAWIISALVIYAALSVLFFKNDHPWNSDPFFIRNKILMFFMSSAPLKIVFFGICAASILLLCAVRLARREYYLMYPFTLLYIAPSWLIEQRYYIIPFTLFMLFKEEDPKRVQYAALFTYVCLSVFIFLGIDAGRFFL